MVPKTASIDSKSRNLGVLESIVLDNFWIIRILDESSQ